MVECAIVPGDPDGDGIFEDLNENGRIDSDDVVVYFESLNEPWMTESAAHFDLNGNDRTDFDDVVKLFEEV